jgi:selenium-dependent xanthine dehydrogenase
LGLPGNGLIGVTRMIEFKLNGNKVSIAEQPGEMLAEMLRVRLKLTGTKVACKEGECGACTVLIDGEPVLSCIYPSEKINGRSVITIEGLAYTDAVKKQNRKMHALQEAFIVYGAVQCGFCIPGQIMTAAALLERTPDPNEEDIKHALKDTLCRCAGYTSIIGAVQAAARSIRTGEAIQPPQIPESTIPHKNVGRILPRPDAKEKVSGSAIYTDDLQFPGMLHARVKRAMLPAAVVRKIDVSQAKALPGVVAVLTAIDIPGEHNHGVIINDWPVLVGIGEDVRTVGDALAIVAAETREIASKAIDLIQVELEPLPIVSDPVQSKLPETRQIHSHGNMLKHIKVRRGDIKKGFADADVILEHTFHTPIIEHAFMEPECSITRLTPEGRLEVYVGSQIPYSDREQVSRILNIPQEQVRIIGQLVGGGFGGKEDIAGQIHAALLTWVTRSPVKLLFDRQESMLVHPKRHATQISIKIGAKHNGCLTAMDSQLYGDTGAYASLGEKVMTRATTHSSGPYQIEHVKADCYAMYTNNPPAGAFRGFGVMQSAFAVESMMDMLAERLEMDPVELRQLNALRIGSITNTGQLLSNSVGLMECIDKVKEEIYRLSGDQPFKRKPVAGAPNRYRAWGFALAFKNTGLGGGAPDKAGAEAELFRDGTFEVRTSSAELGQGLPTVLRLIAAEELNQLPEAIHVLLSDTDLTPDGGPTTASRQTYISGNAVKQAAQALKQLLTSELCEIYDVSPEEIHYIEGLAQVKQQQIPLALVAEKLIHAGRPPLVSTTYWAPETKPLGQGGDMHFAYSFAAQAAEVEVNSRTGEVTVLRIVAAYDVGFAINPLGLRGQIEGGIMMGIGHALTENFIVDKGRVVTDHLSRYRMPSITLTPKITSFVVEHPTSDGPYGAKGVGEIVLVPTSPAITNAIYNATGVRIDHLPVDQEQILFNYINKPD